MKKNKKLLFIAGYFPPAYYSSGSVRAWNIAKYLSKLGWQVTVVTPSPEIWNPKLLGNVESVQSEILNEGIKTIYTKHSMRFMDPGRLRIPDGLFYWLFGGILRRILRYLNIPTWTGWIKSASLACDSIRPDDVDIILATGAPYVSFELAYKFARNLNRPFVLDYRDLWTCNPLQQISFTNHVRRLEDELVKKCSSVVVVSPSMKDKLMSDYEIGDNKINAITNGFDPEKLGQVIPKSFDHFSIVYTGGIVMPFRSLDPFFKALVQLHCDHKVDQSWMFHYLGPDIEIIQTLSKLFHIEKKVIIHGMLPQEEAWAFVKGANLSLIVAGVVNTATIAEKGHIPGKLFETIGLGTPMLVIAPKGSDAEQIVLDSGNGIAIPAQQTVQIVDFIKRIMEGNVPAVKEPQKYSWENLSLRLDAVLREII